MDNEEKKVKTTTAKKTTTTKKATAAKKTTTTKKATTASKPKTTTKKTTSTVKKTATKKAPVKKEEVVKEVVLPKEEKNVEVEKKVVTEPKVKEEKISKKELREIRKKRYIIEAIIIAVLALIVLVLLSNETFLKLSYETKKVNVSLPRFSYFVSDKNNKVKFMTLRKSEYLNEYYNEYLEGFIFYSCAEGKNTFYYNEKTKTLIKEIKIEKGIALKTIEITYDSRTPEEVCGLK